MQKLLLVVGGTSDIGTATARYYAANGWRIVLAARDVEAARNNAQEIMACTGAAVVVIELDVLQSRDMATFVENLPGLPDTVVCVVGMLGEQTRAEHDLNHAKEILRTNFEGPALLLGLLADKLVGRASGAIVGVSSVAGDRGRASNYVYGAAKSGLTTFLAGLRHRLAAKGVRVITVKPGFVRTRMTSSLDLPRLLTAEPHEVAAAIYRAAEKGHGEVVYVRPLWRFIMTVLCAMPERIFKRLPL